jgi:hypothetical protein
VLVRGTTRRCRFQGARAYTAVPIFIRKTECNHEIAPCHLLVWLERLTRTQVSLQAVWVIRVHVAHSPICISDRSDRNASSDAWPSFYLAPLSKGALELSKDLIHRAFRSSPSIHAVGRQRPSTYLFLRDNTETELSRGAGPFANSLVSRRRME